MTSPDRHVLLVHRFYDPDVTTYSQMLSMMAKQLADDGFRVDVFTAQPSYNGIYDGPDLPRVEHRDGIRVLRRSIPGGSSSAGRLIGGILFGLLLVIHAIRTRGRYETILVSTAPPVLMGVFGTMAATIGRSKLVYHCMDLYPEIALASGLTRPGLLARIAQAVDSSTIRRSAKTIVLSEDMLRTVRARGVNTDNVIVRNNFAIKSSVEFEPPALPPVLASSNRFRLIFAGNLGRFQGLDAVLDAFALHLSRTSSTAELVFLGAGAAKSSLEARAEQLHIASVVKFVDHQPLDIAMAAIENSDVAIISLAENLIGAAYPSKTLMYLEMGSRVLAIVEQESDLARMVTGHDLGSVASPGDVEQIAEAIRREEGRVSNPNDVHRAKSVASDNFDAAAILSEWSSLFAGLNREPS